MDTSALTQIIEEKGLRATANRISVLRCLDEASKPLSLADLENVLDTIDKSSIFRSLMAFIEHDVVHEINDGSKSVKYELCRTSHDTPADAEHLHFHCLRCQRTICLHQSPIPRISIPEGYEVKYTNFVVKGICPDCRRKADTAE